MNMNLTGDHMMKLWANWVLCSRNDRLQNGNMEALGYTVC